MHHLERLSEVLREGRLADGNAVDRHEYQAALQETSVLRDRLARVFARVDFLVSPAATGPAPAGLHSTGGAAFNAPWSLAGNPAITLPLFQASESGLPIGCQFAADRHDDDRLLAVGRVLMRTLGTVPSSADD